MAKAKVLNGKDAMFFVNEKATALATSHKLNLNAETSDAASKDSGFWDESIITKMSWDGSTDSLVSAEEGVDSYDVMYDKFIAGEPVDIIHGIPANKTNDGVPEEGWKVPTGTYYKGKALITSLTRNDDVGSNSTMSISWKGVGKLEKVTPA